MSLGADRSYKMKLRDVENAFKYRRIPYPKRSVELIALLAISCTFFLFMHTNKLNSRLKEMEVKLQPSEFSALGLTSNHVSGHDAGKHDDINTLHGTYQYLKSTGQLVDLVPVRLNNTPKAEREFVFFNRIEKTGSQSMTRLINQLGLLNGYETFRNVIQPKRAMTENFEEQREFVHQLTELSEPSVYVEHANWVNFTVHDMPRPIYINLVRHPIEKVISAYYYLRHPKIVGQSVRRNPNKIVQDKTYYDMKFNDCVKQRISPHCVFDAHNRFNGDWRRFALKLCGNAQICEQLNSEATMQMAKMHVEREYSVVGTWEETNITLAVLEAYIPRFFAGATKVYYSQTKKFTVNTTPHDNSLDEEVERYLKDSFKFELELYQFIMQRLYMQYIAINKNQFMDTPI
ncbi:heparan sulfate 2-O-sulfotransferase pipe isoform X6 [Drosophila pseudoobscura]|uniref:Heparan sulfate 2-O-sulfotransferase pipe isoform X6 n=1 Tax=Drosophila pseudoobscura pseudoobscura TaxID=46245 RepID=A0A6I8W2N6_DROPS|nr:heparan sulfate 2-O-sulfotransferase pipe isoform X6 [Drosophila pseudoobscura]